MCFELVLSKINMDEVDFSYQSLVLEMFSLGVEFVGGSLCFVRHQHLSNYQKKCIFNCVAVLAVKPRIVLEMCNITSLVTWSYITV